MKQQKGMRINLASRPLRNRRVFYLLSGFLTAVLLVVAGTAGNTYRKYSALNSQLRSNQARVEKSIREAQREERRLASQIENISARYQERIDLLNSLIFKKSFSWLRFLSALEEALPQSCFIVSMAPSLKGDSRIEVRLEVAFPNLNELLAFNKNLYEQKFTGIRIISESQDENGRPVAEISLTYESTA